MMTSGKKLTGEQCKQLSKKHLIIGIICVILGVLIAIPVLFLGIIILLFGVWMLLVSKGYKDSSTEGMTIGGSRGDYFDCTSEVPGYIKFNDNTKEALILEQLRTRKVKYSDILDFQLVGDGETIIDIGDLMNGNAGGVLFRDLDSVADGNTSESLNSIGWLRIKITIRDMNNPISYILIKKNAFDSDFEYYKKAYDTAQRILAMLKIAISQNELDLQVDN